jgi:cobalt/nickel transport system permease protein
MHLAEGTLSPAVIAVGSTLAVAGWALGSWRMGPDILARTALLGSVFFTVSAIHIPVAGTTVHLLGLGLVGAVLGWRCFPALGVALLLQAIFLGYGGFSTLGVSTTILALPALLAGLAIRGLSRRSGPLTVVGSGLAAALAVEAAALLAWLALDLSGGGAMGGLLLLAHQPVALVEAVVTAGAVGYLSRARPELLGRTAPCV